jgi:hypothetical protein
MKNDCYCDKLLRKISFERSLKKVSFAAVLLVRVRPNVKDKKPKPAHWEIRKGRWRKRTGIFTLER